MKRPKRRPQRHWLKVTAKQAVTTLQRRPMGKPHQGRGVRGVGVAADEAEGDPARAPRNGKAKSQRRVSLRPPLRNLRLDQVFRLPRRAPDLRKAR